MREISDFGISSQGDCITIKIEKHTKNDAMFLNVIGSKILKDLRSLENIKGDYKSLDHDALGKIYKKIADSKSKELEKIIKNFEKDLNKLIKDFEKDLSQY
jgi:Ni,Fe-hydrogenase III large subunit